MSPRKSPWYTQERRNARPEPVQHIASDVADRVLRSINADESTSRPRKRYFATARTGEVVSVLSNRSPEDVAEALRHKVTIAEALAGLPPAVVASGAALAVAPLPAVGPPEQVAAQPPSIPHAPEGAAQGSADAVSQAGAMTDGGFAAAMQAANPVLGAMNPMSMMSMAAMGAMGLQLPRYILQPCTAMLSERAERFLLEVAQRKSTRQGNTEAAFTLRVFRELVGDKPIGQLTIDDADSFIQAMASWPPSASKRREYRLMRAPEVVAKARRLGDTPLNTKTQQTHIVRLRMFFRWLEKRQEIAPGLMRGVRVHRHDKVALTRRLPFTPEHLETIFAPDAIATLRTPYMYWAPVLALYQGMRITEIGQLYFDDISFDGDIPSFQIDNGRPGQRLKTQQSKRELPIHPMVLACGFREFVAQAKRWGRVTLFPDVIWSTNGAGDAISDWFNRYYLRRLCQIQEKTRTFHSFRHNFGTWGRDAIGSDRTRALMGHRTQEDQTTLGMFYGDQRPLAMKARLLAQIPFPVIGHVPYNLGQFEEAFARAQIEERREERLGALYGTQSLARGPRIPQ